MSSQTSIPAMQRALELGSQAVHREPNPQDAGGIKIVELAAMYIAERLLERQGYAARGCIRVAEVGAAYRVECLGLTLGETLMDIEGNPTDWITLARAAEWRDRNSAGGAREVDFKDHTPQEGYETFQLQVGIYLDGTMKQLDAAIEHLWSEEQARRMSEDTAHVRSMPPRRSL